MKKENYSPIASLVAVDTRKDGQRMAMLATGHKPSGDIRLFIGNVTQFDPTEDQSHAIKDHLMENGLELTLKEMEAVKQMLGDSDDFLDSVKKHLDDKLTELNDLPRKIMGFLKNRDN